MAGKNKEISEFKTEWRKTHELKDGNWESHDELYSAIVKNYNLDGEVFLYNIIEQGMNYSDHFEGRVAKSVLRRSELRLQAEAARRSDLLVWVAIIAAVVSGVGAMAAWAAALLK